jgi:hypothetical protein
MHGSITDQQFIELVQIGKSTYDKGIGSPVLCMKYAAAARLDLLFKTKVYLFV